MKPLSAASIKKHHLEQTMDADNACILHRWAMVVLVVRCVYEWWTDDGVLGGNRTYNKWFYLCLSLALQRYIMLSCLNTVFEEQGSKKGLNMPTERKAVRQRKHNHNSFPSLTMNLWVQWRQKFNHSIKVPSCEHKQLLSHMMCFRTGHKFPWQCTSQSKWLSKCNPGTQDSEQTIIIILQHE